MKNILLMRHGEPDYSGPRKWNAPGWGGDLAPLSKNGEQQVLNTTEEISKFSPELILCSPATRAMHTGTILSRKLDLPLIVEFDLHEWVPRLDFSWKTEAEVLKNLDELELLGGEWPKGETRCWEPLSSVRKRARDVIDIHTNDESKILVICHEIVIWALSGVRKTPTAGLRTFN